MEEGSLSSSRSTDVSSSSPTRAASPTPGERGSLATVEGGAFPRSPSRRKGTRSKEPLGATPVVLAEEVAEPGLAITLENCCLEELRSASELEGEPLGYGKDLQSWQWSTHYSRRSKRNPPSLLEEHYRCEVSNSTGFSPTCRGPLVVPGAQPKSLLRSAVDLVAWFGELKLAYGERLLLLLFASQHLLKGVVRQFVTSSMYFLLMEYKVSGPQLQIYASIATASWTLKPVIGLLSDLLPICGYRKGPYLLLSSLAGAACTVMIGFSTRNTATVLFVVACLFGMSLQGATCDLLTEALYSEHIHRDPHLGPDLITYVWGGVSIGSIVALTAVSWVLASLGARAVYLVCFVPSIAIIFPTVLNYCDERPVTSQVLHHTRQAFRRQWEVVFLCALVTVLTIGLSVLGMWTDSQKHHMQGAGLTLCLLVPAFCLFLRPEIAKINVFLFLQAALSVNIGGAAFYFYTDQVEEYPEGPHFSTQFFTTTLGLMSAGMSVLGLLFYTRCLKTWGYQSMFIATNVLMILLSLGDVVLFLRLNVKYHIPDSVFVVGASVRSVVVKQWQWMPSVMAISQLCPTGMEATMFALLAGCENIGLLVSDYFGAYLLFRLGVHPSAAPDESAQFKDLWKAALVETFLPLVVIALVPWLVPRAGQTDQLLVEHVDSAIAGSLFSRWWRKRD